ncbi:MAG: NAD(P)-dependent glycerol-3-phosphate dehydrogenase [Acidobacteria bacterium]|nr:NAD(P)-dependent glycerol-3-phosphate dehydrogenase [Acidobacteriota bacterium]
MARICVLGAGSWGTALAVHFGRIGHDVNLWARDPSLAETMRAEQTNAAYLPGIPIPTSVFPTTSVEEALADRVFVVSAVPSHGTRAVMQSAAAFVPRDAIVVTATKGLELRTMLRVSEVIAQELGGRRPLAVLSGPSFALEVARNQPTAICVASRDHGAAMAVQQEFRGPFFRLYATDDVIGVEMGGAMKNVIAIAAGVNESLGLGPNALAALITRGLAEITRLACATGGRRETLAGLSGLGDLVLTCTGQLSRNRHVGLELGRGRRLPEILASMKMVAEGVKTTDAALELGARYGVELPIAAQMAEVMAGSKQPRAAVEELMLRPQRAEPELA